MKKALVAFGSPITAGSIQLRLSMLHHFEVRVASNADAMREMLGKIEAIRKKIEETKPLLLIVDELLPPFGACRAIASVRAFYSGDIKIIAIVLDREGANPNLVKSLRTAGAHEVIAGGYNQEKLDAKLRVLELFDG